MNRIRMKQKSVLTDATKYLRDDQFNPSSSRRTRPRYSDRQITDKETDKQNYTYTDRHIDRQTYSHTDILTDIHTERQTYRHTVRDRKQRLKALTENQTIGT